MAHASIKQLRIYQVSSQLEDELITLLHTESDDETYDERMKLRRTAAAVSHFIYEAHYRYSYALKVESLQFARRALESARSQLSISSEITFERRTQLDATALSLQRQLSGLIKYLRLKQSERAQQMRTRSVDELIGARR